MRFREIKHLIMQEARLDELKMSPSALEAFAKSDAAKGIQAGFEAEIIVRNAAGGSGEYEPDMDSDTTIDSIDEMRSFFSDGDNSYRQVDQLVQAIEEDGWLDYWFEKQAEYVQENMDDRMDQKFDEWFDDEVEDLVRNALEEAKEYNAKEIDNIIKAGLRQYDEKEWDSLDTYNEMDSIFQDYKVDVAEKAREQFNEDNEEDVREELEQEFNEGEDVDFGDFLRDRFGNRYASTIWEEYNHIVNWPYYTEDYDEGGFNEDAASTMSRELEHLLDMDVTYSMGYHSARRKPNLWIIEPDSSLEPDDSDDMGAEIVSPPMPLDVCLAKMERLFKWASDRDNGNAYTNDSTGFHMGVSLPVTKGNVDFVKLALFLGDEHVLEQFDRSSNTYTEAAIKKIRSRIKNNPTKIGDAMELMKHGLIELAERSITGSQGDGFGKYTSINPKGAYIEFRSAGGVDYIEDFQKAKNTLLRYAQAMSVAANPSAERKEYYKKLYKLISPNGGNSAMDLFARFATGNISAEELKKQWAEAALEKDAPQELNKGRWKVIDKATGKAVPGFQYSGYTEAEALVLAKQSMSPASSWIDFEQMFDEKYELRDVSKNTGKWAIIDRTTGETVEVVPSEHRDDAARRAIDLFGDISSFYIEPAPGDNPAPKLSRRAELAKRIKQGKNRPQYIIVDKSTGQQGESFPADSLEGARAYANRVARASGHAGDFNDKFTLMRVTDTGLQPVQQSTPIPGSTQDIQQQRAAQQQAPEPMERRPEQATTISGVPMWEIYVRSSGDTVNRFPDHNQTAAWSTAQQWLRDAEVPEQNWGNYSVRPQVNDTTAVR